MPTYPRKHSSIHPHLSSRATDGQTLFSMPRPAWIMCAHGNVAAQRLCNCRLACTHPAFIIDLTTQSEMTHTLHNLQETCTKNWLLWWRHQNMAPVPSVQQKLATNCMNEWSELKNEMCNICLGSRIHGLNSSLETHALSSQKPCEPNI